MRHVFQAAILLLVVGSTFLELLHPILLQINRGSVPAAATADGLPERRPELRVREAVDDGVCAGVDQQEEVADGDEGVEPAGVSYRRSPEVHHHLQ